MPKQEKESLGKQFQDLEKIAEKMQDPNADIEESLELFEKGMQIASKAQKRLKDLENKIIVLKKRYKVDKEEEE